MAQTRLSRREFLRLATLGGLGLVAGTFYPGDSGSRSTSAPLALKRHDPKVGLELDENDLEISFDEASQIALLVGKASVILELDHGLL